MERRFAEASRVCDGRRRLTAARLSPAAQLPLAVHLQPGGEGARQAQPVQGLLATSVRRDGHRGRLSADGARASRRRRHLRRSRQRRRQRGAPGGRTVQMQNVLRLREGRVASALRQCKRLLVVDLTSCDSNSRIYFLFF